MVTAEPFECHLTHAIAAGDAELQKYASGVQTNMREATIVHGAVQRFERERRRWAVDVLEQARMRTHPTPFVFMRIHWLLISTHSHSFITH